MGRLILAAILGELLVARAAFYGVAIGETSRTSRGARGATVMILLSLTSATAFVSPKDLRSVTSRVLRPHSFTSCLTSYPTLPLFNYLPNLIHPADIFEVKI